MRNYIIFFLIAFGTIIIDQNIKSLFVDGYFWDSSCISLEFHLNRGVAFSMFASLGEYLKWIQVLIISGMFIYVVYDGYLKQFPLSIGLLLGSAVSNLSDRFLHGGVVDYIAWHCGLDFAIFNYADIMINISVLTILVISYFNSKDS